MTEERELGRIEAILRASIRLCEEDDLAALEWLGLFAPHRRIIHETFAAQTRGEQLMLLGVAADFPIAQVWIDLARKRREGVAVLWAVRVFPPLQGAGIGRQMMTAAERAMRGRGIRRAELEVERDDPAPLGFYQQLGWHMAGSTSREGERPPFLILSKDLDRTASHGPPH